MFSGEGGREAGGQVPTSVIEYLNGKGYSFRIERGTGIVSIIVRGVAMTKVWSTKKKIMGLLAAANAPHNVEILFLD